MIAAMVDLETLDTTPTSVILTLGAVKFDPYSFNEPHSELYMKIDVDEQSTLGRTTSDSTIEWWSKQNEDVQNEAFSTDGRLPVNDCLSHLTKWLVGVDVIWCHGYGFDMTILENLYRSVGKPVPWNFWQVKDSRTLFDLCPSDPRKSIQSDLHNALADSYFQAKAVQIAFDLLKIKKD